MKVESRGAVQSYGKEIASFSSKTQIINETTDVYFDFHSFPKRKSVAGQSRRRNFRVLTNANRAESSPDERETLSEWNSESLAKLSSLGRAKCNKVKAAAAGFSAGLVAAQLWYFKKLFCS